MKNIFFGSTRALVFFILLSCMSNDQEHVHESSTGKDRKLSSEHLSETTAFRINHDEVVLRGNADQHDLNKLDQPDSKEPGLALIAELDSKDNNTSQADEQEPLLFPELLESTEAKFPLILAAMETIQIARGERVAAQGDFDLRLKSKAGVNREGYYENETASVTIEQPLEDYGATLFGGYKIGTGDFASYDGDLQTQDEGEYSVGVRLPLLAGRSIDKRRISLWKSRISEAQAQPLVLEKKLEVTRKAAATYWKWVAAGQKLEISKRLLKLAEMRHKTIMLEVQEGQKPDVSLVENRQLVVERKLIMIRAERMLQQSGIALSLYWRDADGVPKIPSSRRLPSILPKVKDPKEIIKTNDVILALQKRPELEIYELKKRKLLLEAQLANNNLLPKLYLSGEVSKDVGSGFSNPDTKDDLETKVFLYLDIPLQRRKAKGQMQIILAKVSQLDQAKKLAQNKIAAGVMDGASALKQIWLSIDQVSEHVKLALEIEQIERLKLNEGESDLLRVNLREQKTASAAAKRVDVITEYFWRLADYRASLGLSYNDIK